MKPPSAPTSAPAPAQTPSALRGGSSPLRFDPATGQFTARQVKSPSDRRTAGRLSTILQPGARGRWMLPHTATLTPERIEWILRSALTTESPRAEQELYDLMEATWPRLLKNRMEVTDSVISLDWQLIDAPEGENLPGMKDLVRRTTHGMCGDPIEDGQGWRGTLEALLSAWFRGVAISEIDWEYRPGSLNYPSAWLPRQTREVDPRHFGWKSDGRLMLYPEAQPESATDFPPDKFLIAIRKAGRGHPSGTALLRALAWWWCAANFSAEWLLNFAQIFGQPFRWATYAAGQDGVRDELAAMMEDMGSAAWGIGPDGSTIEFHETSQSGADNPQSHLLDRADTACDLLILGQTLTGSVSKEGGSRALGDVHNAVRSDLIDTAANWLAEVVNEQLIPAIARINVGQITEDAALPYFAPARKNQKDSKALAETFEIILRSGIPLLKQEVYEALDMSQPRPGEDAFSGTPAAAPADPAPALRAMLAKLPQDARDYFLSRLQDES